MSISLKPKRQATRITINHPGPVHRTSRRWRLRLVECTQQLLDLKEALSMFKKLQFGLLWIAVDCGFCPENSPPKSHPTFGKKTRLEHFGFCQTSARKSFQLLKRSSSQAKNLLLSDLPDRANKPLESTKAT